MQGVLSILLRNKIGLTGLALLIFFVIIAIFAPYIAPFDPYQRGVAQPFEPPSWEHLLGTNDVGADLFSELIYGSRVSLLVAFSTALIATLLGTIVGLLSGYYGRKTDALLMRAVDVFLALPAVPLMVLLAAYMGPSLTTVILVIPVVGWARIARIVRSQVLVVKETQFVEAARVIGASDIRIMLSHIIPNVAGLIVANAVLLGVLGVIAEAGLSFLGLGDPTHKSWGMMLYYAQLMGALSRGAWWWILVPGICIMAAGCAFNFVGSTLSDAFSPRLRKR